MAREPFTDAKVRSKIRAAMREVWRSTVRDDFIREVRIEWPKVTGKYKYGVVCADCGRVMGQTEKERETLKDGSLSKRPRIAYEVDHIDPNHEFRDLLDLGAYAQTLFKGDLQILCRTCHKAKTRRSH